MAKYILSKASKERQKANYNEWKKTHSRANYLSDYYKTHKTNFHKKYILNRDQILLEHKIKKKEIVRTNPNQQLSIREVDGIKHDLIRVLMSKALGKTKYSRLGSNEKLFIKGIQYYIDLAGGIKYIPKPVIEYIYNSSFYPKEIPLSDLSRFVKIYTFYNKIVIERGKELTKNEISSFYIYAKNHNMTPNDYLKSLRTWK